MSGKRIRKKIKIKDRSTSMTVASSSDNRLKIKVEGKPDGTANNKSGQ